MAQESHSPFDVHWPVHTRRTTLRPVTLDDVEAMWAYRRLPHVCQFLTHDPLSREDVTERIRRRLPGHQDPNGPAVCGVAIMWEGNMVGDAMLRVDGRELWIGYALHPSTWGHGIASEVATELVTIGEVLGLTVYADVFVDNAASERVLQHAGLTLHGESVKDGRRLLVYGPPPTTLPRNDRRAQ